MLREIKILVNTVVGNRQDRYESRHAILAYISKYFGFRLGNRYLTWHKDEEFSKVYSEVASGPSSSNIPERKFVLYSIAKSIQGVPGDIAETGVYIGESSYLMMKASEATEKCFYGFDSFEGLSEPDNNDWIPDGYIFKWGKHDLSVPEDIARRNLTSFEGRFSLLKGWIPDRFHEVDSKRFSLVHIDVDLYQPTLDSIQFFWQRINVGGVLLCDDYGFETCPGARKAMDDFFGGLNLSVIHLPTGQGVVFKQ